jgi:uncharacterized repeat protein (TIGR01451 family)
LTGGLTTHPGSVIEVEDPEGPAHLTIADGFLNHGTLTLNDIVEQSVTVQSGTLNNAADGTIQTVASGLRGIEPPMLAGELDNQGLLEINGLDLVVKGDGSQFVNSDLGEITVADAELTLDLTGVLEVPSNFTNYGSITVAGGGSIRVNGAAGALDVPSNFTNYGSITVAGGGSVRVNGAAGAGDGSAMAAINHGLIHLETGGQMTLDGATYTQFPTGELSGNGTLDLSASAPGGILEGTVSPGSSPGVLNVTGALVEGPSAEILIEIGGENPGSGHDRLAVTGTLTAGGEIDVDLLEPYHPVGGEQYEVVTFGSLAGAFAGVKLPHLMHLLVWSVVETPQSLLLEVLCEGVQLGVGVSADNDPVSVGEDVTYFVTVTNASSLPATDLVVTDVLPASLIFDQALSSPECFDFGGDVRCERPLLDPGAVWNLTIVAEAAVAGPITNTVLIDSWECDVLPDDNQSSTQVNAVLAERCDANYDLSIDSDDLVPSVAHIFGAQAPGNPDCRIGGGVTADDLAATIEAGQ